MRIPAWKVPPRTSHRSSASRTCARKAVSVIPTLSWFFDDPLILAEPPGPCGAGRLCYASVVCCAAGVPGGLDGAAGVPGGGGPGCGAGLLGVLVWGGPPVALLVVPGCLVCSWAAARPPSALRASLGASTRCPARPRRRPPAPRPGPCLEAWPGSAAASNRAALVVCVSSWLRRCPPVPRQVPPVPSRPAVPSLLCVAPSCPPLNNFACNCPPAKC